MSDLRINQRSVESTRSAIADLIGLNLSEEEAKRLLTAQSLSFQDLTTKRNLSEIGLALIRLDALSHLSQDSSPQGDLPQGDSPSESVSQVPPAAAQHRCKPGCHHVEIFGVPACICPQRRELVESSPMTPLSIDINSD